MIDYRHVHFEKNYNYRKQAGFYTVKWKQFPGRKEVVLSGKALILKQQTKPMKLISEYVFINL